jgi:glycosidase
VAGIAEEGPFGLREAPGYGGRPTGITTINLRNPEVRAYFDRYFLYWADPNGDGDFSDGVDGFRIDHMMDDLDNKGLLTNLFAEFWTPLFARLRAANPRIHIIAEQADWGFGGDFLTRGDADMVFAFPLRGAILSFDKAQIVEAIARTEAVTPADGHQLLFIENHDTPRIASAQGMSAERLRTAAGLSIFLRGTPLLYYGQELGMRGAQWTQMPDDRRDIAQREAFEWEALTEAPSHANWYRDEEIYWTQRYSRDRDGVSVAEEARDPSSLLSYYRRALALRRAHPALQSGAQRVLESPAGILAVERTAAGERFVLVANLSDAPAQYEAPGADQLSDAPAGAITLGPDQLALFRDCTARC